jgi:D-xylose transport system permease protein
MSQDRGTATNPLSGVPIVVPIVIGLLMIGTFLLDRTRYGRYLYAIGGNREAARRSGVNVTMVRWTAFIICSSVAVLAGIFYISRVGSADAATGREIVLSGVAAAVVGGVSLFGGRGRLIHAVVGALVLSTIENGLLLLGLPAGVYLAVSGGVLILAATVDAVARRKQGQT